MDDIHGRTEDEGTITCLAVQREGIEREGSKSSKPMLEAVHARLQ